MSKAQRKPFQKGDEILVSVRAGAGTIGYTEQPAIVKEMAGARNVAVTIFGKDRIVPLTDCSPVEKAIQAPERPMPAPFAKVSDIATAKKLEAPAHFAAKPGPPEHPATIGQLMLKERTEKGMNADLMARMLRVDKAQLGLFESGEELPGDDVVLRFADVLDVPLEALLAGVETAKRAKAKLADEATNPAATGVQRRVNVAREIAAVLWDEQVEDVYFSFTYGIAGWCCLVFCGTNCEEGKDGPDNIAAADKLIAALATKLGETATRIDRHAARLRAFKLPDSCQVSGVKK